MYYFNVCAIIYLTSEGFFFDKRFKTLLSIAPFSIEVASDFEWSHFFMKKITDV